MNYAEIYSIAHQGLQFEKLRIEVVATNVANQHSVQTSDHKSYEPMQVMVQAKPFQTYLTEGGKIADFKIIPQNLAPTKSYQPGHPAADKEGYVNSPGLSMVNEMTTLLAASRAYEANVKILNCAHSLYMQALRIGDSQ